MKFSMGEKVRKTSGSQWKGTVVGTYSTELTPEGYAVESASEVGSVQIYPAKALEAWAEGAVDLGSDAWMALHLLDRLDVDADNELRVQQIEEIVRRMGAALSAVTAERDGEHDQSREWLKEHYELQAERDQLRAEAEALRKAFGECIQSLHDEMLQSYGGQRPDDMHPVTRRNYDRDMAEIAEYRAVIAAKE